MSHPYRYFHFLSLDIVLGAMATSVMAARLFESKPGWAWWVSLAMTVWVLYTGDHLLDAWKHRKSSQREMHNFIFRKKGILIYALGVVTVADLIVAFNFLEPAILRVALLMVGAVFLFYAMRHIFKRNKLFFIPGELLVLIIYLAGTWMGPFISRTLPADPGQILVLAMMAGVLLLNLGVISLYDVKIDSRLGISTLAGTLGKKSTRNMMIATAMVVFLMAVLQFMVYGAERTSKFALILVGMAGLLLWVLLTPSLFRKQEAYRLVADALLGMGLLSLLI
ncbi:MAG: hypothetical protein QNK35_17360 [Bacteroides sp.]|nr:hypothetical protein [Bacteroides sp.]